MDPMIIVFAIRAMLRLSREGKAAFDQFQRDHEIILPDGLKVEWTELEVIVNTFFPGHRDLVEGNGPYAAFWNMGPSDVPGALEALSAGAVQIRSAAAAVAKGQPAERGMEVGGLLLVQQWAAGKGPVGPFARMALTLADVSLEFVGANPSVMGVGGSGEKLIGAVAANLAAMIPDDGEQFGDKSQLAQRFAAIFLRAGLQALNDNSGTLIRQEHLQKLVESVLPPLVASLPATLPEQARWREVTDALLGPAANAAIATVAANPTAFLGREFESNRVLGALTHAVLQEANKTGVRGALTEAGFASMYKAALGVAAERPELFLGTAGKPVEQLAQSLFAGIATTLQNNPPPFDADLGAQLAVTALDVVRQRGPALFPEDGRWDSLMGALVGQVASGLQAGITGGSLERAFSRPQLLELGRVFLRQVALTPSLIAPDSDELQRIVAAVAKAMADDKALLLTADDWLEIAAVAAREAAANPGRLFKNETSLGGTLATALIRDLLGAAASELTNGGRARGGVLAGATLREAIRLLLEAAAGNSRAALANRAGLAALVSNVSQEVFARPELYGAKEWLTLYRSLLAQVLNGDTPPPLTQALAHEILTGGAA